MAAATALSGCLSAFLKSKVRRKLEAGALIFELLVRVIS
jgi:hypothetical protein